MSDDLSTASESRKPALHRRINATVVLVIVLPLFAIVASVGTAVVAVTRGDPVLPDRYHWEGEKLDHDFALSQRAAQLHVGADLRLQPVEGLCRADLRIDGESPEALQVTLIHGSRASLDRQLHFLREGDSSSYTAQCQELPAGTWHVELSDAGNTWAFRDDETGDLADVKLYFKAPR
ncbi:MAG TPA: FixH family protein [Steroidobacteraceae bacterium]|nr:FixH family protein [Steroidobacteraceae bacterium]